MLSGSDYILVGLAAVAAGAVNALAGGGTLITFPTLLAFGVAPISANVTNTVALCPGYMGATLAQLRDMRGQKKRLSLFLCAGVIGGVIGGIFLLNTGEKAFRDLIPFLILTASGLLAAQSPIRTCLMRRSNRPDAIRIHEARTAFIIGLAAIYGGYFGAGLSVIVLAVLGLMLEDTLTRLNAVKQAIAFSANSAAAIFFLFSNRVVWPVGFVMAAGAIAGGVLGGRLASRIKSDILRWVVVVIGVTVAVAYLLR
jgi:uncharacterized membrane protein YfcA